MVRSILLFVAITVVTVLSGPLALLMSQVGQPDPEGFYLVLTLPSYDAWLDAHLSAAGAREVSPTRAIFARMILVTEVGHTQLSEMGVVLLPASRVAALCGVTPTLTQSRYRNPSNA